MQTVNDMKKKTAIVILAFENHDCLELALACHAKFSVPAGVPIFILQNGRGTYDTERTYALGLRYQELYPETIRVVDHIPPQKSYSAIKQLFDDSLFSEYEYIVKLDDDVMVLTPDWIDKMLADYAQAYEAGGDRLAYVTSLVNNNPWGFKKTIESNEALAEEYFANQARTHMIGSPYNDPLYPSGIVSKDTIYDGGYGTIWHLPYITRWLHERTSLRPEYFVDSTKELPTVEIDPSVRYSINCLLFRKSLWDDISTGEADDEGMMHVYCMKHKKLIVADLAVPMVHIAFYSQRAEIRDMMPAFRAVYTKYLALPFPIAVCSDKLADTEDRLHCLEKNMTILTQQAQTIQELSSALRRTEYDLSQVHASVSFRLGRILTWLPRMLRDGFKHLRGAD